MFREAIEKEHEHAKIHYSGEVFNLKKKSEVLGLQGFYKEAKKIRKMVRALEDSEKEKHETASKEKFIKRSKLLVGKH